MEFLVGAGLELDKLIGSLDQFKSISDMPLVVHMQTSGYDYELRTNGQWSVSVTEQCLLSLGKCLKNEQFYVEY